MYSIIFYYVLLLCFYFVFLYISLCVFILLLFAWFEKPKPNTQGPKRQAHCSHAYPLAPNKPKTPLAWNQLHEAMHTRHTYSPSTCRFLPCPISFKPLTPYSLCHVRQLPLPLIPKSLSTLAVHCQSRHAFCAKTMPSLACLLQLSIPWQPVFMPTSLAIQMAPTCHHA